MDPNLITLKVFSGAKFGESPMEYDGTVAGSSFNVIPNMDRDLISYFDLEDLLKPHGYRSGDSLYFLKPGYVAPSGLVFIQDDNQCKLLLSEHIGKDTCTLYIVPPERQISRMTVHGGTSKPSLLLSDSGQGSESYAGTDSGQGSESYAHSSDDSEDEVGLDMNEEDQWPKHYLFEGGDDTTDFYTSKKNASQAVDRGVEFQDKGKGKATVVESERAKMRAKRAAKGLTEKVTEIVCLSDGPDDGNRSLERDETARENFVHRSRGINGIFFDDSTMKNPHIEVGMLFTCGKQFREAMKNLIIRGGREVKRLKNEGQYKRRGEAGNQKINA